MMARNEEEGAVMEEVRRKSERIQSINRDDFDEYTIFDLGTAGACCFHTKPKDKGAIVQVKINEVVVEAKVIYCMKRDDGYRIGLQFWKVPFDRQKKLDFIVDSYSKGVPVKSEILEVEEE